MISEKYKCGTFKAALDDVRYLKVSDGTRVQVNCLRNILIP
jgi:hypothetical protein